MPLGLIQSAGSRRSARLALALCVGAAASATTGPAQSDTQMSVAVESGNVVLVTGGARKTLTSKGLDSEAVLDPDRQWVIYTRSARPPPQSTDDALTDCSALSSPDELRQVKIDGSGDQLLVRGRGGADPSQALCGFQNKQFSSDGGSIYFLSPAWATSSALYVFSRSTQNARYIMPSNDYVVLSWCTSDLKDGIIAQQHRYFRFGGSFDWYWLFDATGKTEIGPIGEFESVEAIKTDLEASGQCQG